MFVGERRCPNFVHGVAYSLRLGLAAQSGLLLFVVTQQDYLAQ